MHLRLDAGGDIDITDDVDRKVTTDTFGGLNLASPGQYVDGETGLWYNWHRYYDPSLGRYLQSDPFELRADANTYGYVGGNALTLIDPFGLQASTIQCDGAIKQIFPLTAASGNEWGGRIYRMQNGKYSYTTPEEGNSKDMGKVPSLVCPGGGTNEGMYHTRPNGRPYVNGTGDSNRVSGGDQDWAEKERAPIFVGTPNGNILKYTPNGKPFDGPVIIIGKVKNEVSAYAQQRGRTSRYEKNDRLVSHRPFLIYH